MKRYINKKIAVFILGAVILTPFNINGSGSVYGNTLNIDNTDNINSTSEITISKSSGLVTVNNIEENTIGIKINLPITSGDTSKITFKVSDNSYSGFITSSSNLLTIYVANDTDIRNNGTINLGFLDNITNVEFGEKAYITTSDFLYNQTVHNNIVINVVDNNSSENGNGNEDTENGNGNEDTENGNGNEDTENGNGNEDTENGNGNEDTENGNGNEDTENGNGNEDTENGNGNEDTENGNGNEDTENENGNTGSTSGSSSSGSTSGSLVNSGLSSSDDDEELENLEEESEEESEEETNNDSANENTNSDTTTPNTVIDTLVLEKFTDLSSHWAFSSIAFVVREGLFNGISETEFAPNNNMTRGMFVTVLSRMVEIEEYNNGIFSDVPENMWYTNPINWAVENNITKGISENSFAPDNNVTREQMAVFLHNYIKAFNIELPLSENKNSFSDDNSISSWAKESINIMQQAGILNGKGNNIFDPQGLATRGEVATMINNFVESIEEK